MEILEEINGTGHTTIILVTHDPDLSARASRLIELVDGRIVRDQANK